MGNRERVSLRVDCYGHNPFPLPPGCPTRPPTGTGRLRPYRPGLGPPNSLSQKAVENEPPRGSTRLGGGEGRLFMPSGGAAVNQGGRFGVIDTGRSAIGMRSSPGNTRRPSSGSSQSFVRSTSTTMTTGLRCGIPNADYLPWAVTGVTPTSIPLRASAESLNRHRHPRQGEEGEREPPQSPMRKL